MRVFSFFYKDIKGVHQAALLLAITAFFNGLLALFRDRLLAGTFGAGQALDIYYAAFKIPDLIFSFSLFIVASTAFIPLFLEHEVRSRESAKYFLDSVFTLFCIVILVMVALVFPFLPKLIRLIVPGFGPDAVSSTVELTKILLLSPIFLGVSSLVSGVLQSSRRFAVYALSPVVYNLGIIAGVLVLVPRFGLKGLAVGVIVGAFLHLLVQVPTLSRLRYVPRLRLSFDSDIIRLFRFSFPRAFALSFNQITFWFLTAIASLIGAGAIAIFNFSYNLYALPLVIIGLSYSVAAFPTMAESVVKKDKTIFFDHLYSTVRHIIFWTVPAAFLIIVLRAHIVRIILGTGAFGWADTDLTAASLFLFALSIIFQSVVTLFVRAYYALGKVKEPILSNIAASLFTVAAAFLISFYLKNSVFAADMAAQVMRLEDTALIALIALPFAYTMGALLNAVLLGRKLFKLDGAERARQVGVTFFNSLFISLIMATSVYIVLNLLSRIVDQSTFVGIFVQGFVSLFVGVVVGIALMWWFDNREFNEIKAAVTERFWQKEGLQPDTEHL